MNLNPGDTVVHIRDGVARVIRIEEVALNDDESGLYCILSPIYDQGSKLYVPLERADTFLRPLITREEINELITSLPEREAVWISDEKERQRTLQQDLKSGSHEALLTIITSLYQKRREIGKTGKKFHSADEHFLKEAEKTINREFAYVLGIAPDEVPEYIHNRLKNS